MRQNANWAKYILMHVPNIDACVVAREACAVYKLISMHYWSVFAKGGLIHAYKLTHVEKVNNFDKMRSKTRQERGYHVGNSTHK